MKDRVFDLLVEEESFWHSVAQKLRLKVRKIDDQWVYFKGTIAGLNPEVEDPHIEYNPGNRTNAPKDKRLLRFYVGSYVESTYIQLDQFQKAENDSNKMAGLIRASIKNVIVNDDESSEVVKGANRFKMSFVQDLMGDPETDIGIVPEFSITGTLNQIYSKLKKDGFLDSTLSSWIQDNIDKVAGEHVEIYELDNPNERNYLVFSTPELSDDAILKSISKTNEKIESAIDQLVGESYREVQLWAKLKPKLSVPKGNDEAVLDMIQKIKQHLGSPDEITQDYPNEAVLIYKFAGANERQVDQRVAQKEIEIEKFLKRGVVSEIDSAESFLNFKSSSDT